MDDSDFTVNMKSTFSMKKESKEKNETKRFDFVIDRLSTMATSSTARSLVRNVLHLQSVTLTRQRLSVRTMSAASFPVTATIQEKLQKAFAPTHLEVLNESHRHNVYVYIMRKIVSS